MCSGLQRQRGRALNSRKTSVGYLYLSQQKRKFLWPPYYTAVSRGWSIKKKQGWCEAYRQKANSLTFIRRVRSDFKPNKSLYSFLPCSFPSSQTDRYSVSLFSQTHILLASVFPTNLHYKKKKKKLIPLPIILHYRRGNNPMLIIFTINLSFEDN